jgi:hypothetical protein
VFDAQPPLAAGDANPVRFWGAMMAAGPAVAAILPPLAVWLLGGFEDFEWVDQQVTPAQSFGILGAMCFPAAAFFFAQGMFDQALARVSRTWPTAPGVVGSSEKRERSTRRGTVYNLAVSYSYTVGGLAYDGDTVEFGPKWVPDEGLIDRLARKYPARTAVTVHFDPAAPDRAVLETAEDMAFQGMSKVWILLGAPLAFTLLMAVLPLFQ